MKYEAKQVGATTTPMSQASGAPWVNISQTDAMADSKNVAGCSGCHLITNAEWLTIAQNVLAVPSNWSGGAVGSGYIYSGHNDIAPNNALAADSNDANGYSGETNTGGTQRRTLKLTNGATIWDLAGNVYEWVDSTIAANQQPGISGESALAWKNWNIGNMTLGGLSATFLPSYGTPAASGWASTQGIGQLYSNAGDTSTSPHGFLRGSDWKGGDDAGVLSLLLGAIPSATGPNVGFRVSR
jgi:formylglycine-generating enzyme required for sulfatase activity